MSTESTQFILPQFKLDFIKPKAKPEATIIAPHKKARFQILSPTVVRCEFNSNGVFEDLPTRIFWFREQNVPKYTTHITDSSITIETDALTLIYTWSTTIEFNEKTLHGVIKLNGEKWKYELKDVHNLKGTCRTLDGISGKCNLEDGLISRKGYTLFDDTSSFILDENYWVASRKNVEVDTYLFVYGSNYQQCLNDFAALSGRVPIIPRFSLGNWWSRYYAYTQQELLEVIQGFEDHQIPLSTCVIDMDWHITEIDPGKKEKRMHQYSKGWTGYTWNTKLFPNPQKLIDTFHEKNLKVSLNLHPAEGVHPHEEAYRQFAEHMNIDPSSNNHIPFDIIDPKFVYGYFKFLHHPHEKMGIDFWWMDWQHGYSSKLKGVDPLFWLNHLHFYDLSRDSSKKPFIFSRYGGIGNHRYPIGFSGDTIITWDSLAFQPYLTATASNVLYGWWSHDIGGHYFGFEEDELYVRWAQFGVFSPILRIHCTKTKYLDRRPWIKPPTIFQLLKEALNLRHELIPYIYTMAEKFANQNIPLVRPMYYVYPDLEQSYHFLNQYMFGDLLMAPIISKRDEWTNQSRTVVWLPKGDWYNFFTGEYFMGDRVHVCYNDLNNEFPVFAKSGSIIPLGKQPQTFGVELPEKLKVLVFVGADGEFTLYEDDDGVNPKTIRTKFTQKWKEAKLIFIVDPVEGDSTLAKNRKYEFCFYGITEPQTFSVIKGNQILKAHSSYDPKKEIFTISEIEMAPTDNLEISFVPQLSRRSRLIEKIENMLFAFKLDTGIKRTIDEDFTNVMNDITLLNKFYADKSLAQSQFRALIEVIKEVGVEIISNASQETHIILWNNNKLENCKYRYTVSNMEKRSAFIHQSKYGVIPKIEMYVPDHAYDQASWKVSVSLLDSILNLDFHGDNWKK